MSLLDKRISNYDELLRAARREIQLDIIIRDTNILNVLTGELLKGDIGIHKGFIVGLFDKSLKANNTIDGTGKTAIPSFIDPHVHIESSMILPNSYSEIVAAQGTGTIFADPHEIVNVMGIEGFNLMKKNTKDLPMRIYLDAPSCVPSKRDAESSGADIHAEDINTMIKSGAKKIGELMSIEEIISGDPILTDIIKEGWKNGIPRDAHYPILDLSKAFGMLSFSEKIRVFSGLIGSKITKGKHFNSSATKILIRKMRQLDHSALNAYLTALGLTSDHENLGPELQIKLDYGMRVLLKSPLEDLGGMLVESVKRLRYKDSIGITSDDVWLDELINKGAMIGVIKELVGYGLDPIDAVRFATINNAQRLAQAGFQDASLLGSISPGQVADIVLLNGPLDNFDVNIVINEGRIVAKGGKCIFSIPEAKFSPKALKTVNVPQITEDTIVLHSPNNTKDKINTRILEIPEKAALPLPILSQERIPIKDGILDSSKYTMICVLNRYGKSKKAIKGLIKGFPVENGAIASTVAHDSHNLTIIGSNPKDMSLAANSVVQSNGGITAYKNGKKLAHISLPIGGLMSDASINETSKSILQYRDALESLGLDSSNPLLHFVIFSLPSVPGPKVTDLGLWDDQKAELVPLFVED
ncbi:MAG: amidohydrolase family protein [Candidatus Lokiarchaeota archaeon]|nr:amidohydrolase family protein [Candidatus Lokiarchaeota archaeon]MBD3201675.1 amidohydrolase family protein [Candidatus Lokiarchaeota archaeon]